MTEHTITISHDPLLKLAAAYRPCGEWSMVQGHARDTVIAGIVAERTVEAYGDTHTREAVSA